MKRLSLLDDSVSLAERVWSLVGLLAPAGVATFGALSARGLAIFEPYGWFGYSAVFVGFWVASALAMFLIRRSGRDQAYAAYMRTMSIPPTGINPMLSSFTDAVVRVQDLLVPGRPQHDHKHFKRCKIVGPGALYLTGGTILRGTIEVPIIAVAKGAQLLGVPSLQFCTLEDCEVIGLTLFVDQTGGRLLAADGATVFGLLPPAPPEA